MRKPEAYSTWLIARMARPGVHRLGEVFDPDATVAHGHDSQRDAAIGEVPPGVDVGRVFLGRRDHVVVDLPGEALGDQAEADGGIADEGDFRRIGAQERGEPGAG